jgi:acyl-CoA thioesterase FadM
MKQCTIVMSVLEEDKDEQGHLRYWKYGRYFDEGRRQLERTVGVEYRDLEKEKLGFFVVDVNTSHSHEVAAGEIVTVYSRFGSYEHGLRLTIEQEMHANGKIVARMETKNIFIRRLDSGKAQPVRPPKDILERIYGCSEKSALLGCMQTDLHQHL